MSSPYLEIGANASGASASPYASIGAASSPAAASPYASVGAGAPAAPAKGGGGFLGAIGRVAHVVADKAGLAAHDIKSIPGGLVQIGKAASHDIAVANTKIGLGTEYDKRQATQHPGWELPAIGSSIVKQSAHAVEHPLADPFITLTTIAPFLRGLGSGALRAGAAVDTARTGGSVGDVVKAAAAKPEPPPRLISTGDTKIPLHASTNPAMRIVQAGYDKIIQNALTNKPDSFLGGHAANRVGNAINETARYQTRMRGTPADMIEAGGRARGLGVPRPVAEHAFLLTSENSTPAEAIAYHQGQLAKLAQAHHDLAGAETDAARKTAQQTIDELGQSADHMKQIKLASRVHDAGVITQDLPAAHADLADAQDALTKSEPGTPEYQQAASAVKQAQAAVASGGHAVIDAMKYPRLADLDAQIASAQTHVDQIAKEHDLMTEEELAARRNGPARIRNGAIYETPTPGKMGVSAPLENAQTRVDRLQKAYDALEAKGQRGGYATVERPATVEEAQQRLQELEPKVEGFRQGVAAKMFAEKLTPQDKAEQLRRNASNAKFDRQQSGKTRAGRPSGASGNKVQRRLPTVKTEQSDMVDQEIQRLLDKHKDEPWAQAAQHQIDELDALRQGLSPIPGDEPVTGTVHATEFKSSTPTLERMGAATSVAKDELEQQQRRVHGYTDDDGVFHQGLERPVGLVGGDTARAGRGFVTHQSEEATGPKNSVSGSSSPVIGVPRSFIPKFFFEGKNMARGLIPDNTTRLVAQHYRDAIRYVNTDAFRRLIVKTGSDTRRSKREVLIRDPDVTAETLAEEHGITVREAQKLMQITPEHNQILGRTHSTLDELGAGTEEDKQTGRVAGFEDYLNRIVPSRDPQLKAIEKSQDIGTKAPAGYKWIDENMLGDLGKTARAGSSKAGDTVKTINSAVTAATVYFKLGHFPTRLSTDAVTNIIEGSAAPKEIGRSWTAWHALTPLDQQRLLAASGQHGYAALPHEAIGGEGRVAKYVGSPINRKATAGANWWAHHIDAPFRASNFLFEARKAGFHTPEQIHDLLDKLENPEGLDAAQTAKVEWVAKRTNRASIAYDRLNNFERNFITRAFWFYPWTKGAFMFGAHTFAEHPYKTFGLGAVGQQGREQQQRVLGQVPSYEGGLIPLGSGQKPLTTDLSMLTPFASVADVIDAAAHPGQLSGFLNPVYSAGLGLATGTNQYGAATTHPVGDAVSTLFSPTPEAQILNAYLHRKQDQSKRMFHTTPLSAFLRSLAGPALPRDVNSDALHSAATREIKGSR